MVLERSRAGAGGGMCDFKRTMFPECSEPQVGLPVITAPK